MKRVLITIIAAFLVFAQTAIAQESPKADVSIRFYDKTMYYPETPSENPVNVHVTISNTGTSTLRFKLANDRMFSIDFQAFNVKNTQLPQTQSLLRKRTTNQTIYFREISLEPGEEMSFVENLKDYLTIKDPSIYYVELTFYPELYQEKEVSFASNRLTLEIHPSPSAATSSVLPVQSGTTTLLQAEPISPDKVIEQTIIARQRSLWDQFFLYMDVEEMLKRDPSRQRKYALASADARSEMIRAFKADLMQERIDTNIVAIPYKFEIETTTYSQTEGIVQVLEYFKNDTYTEKKRYTYNVRQRDGIWQIYDYTVDNIGSE